MFIAACSIVAPNWTQPNDPQQLCESAKCVYSSTEKVHNNNKEWTITLHNNRNKSQKHCTKQKTPDAKDYILYDSLCMKS